MPSSVVLLPDAGTLITLAYADALDLLREPGWAVVLVDMVLHELTRNLTPTSEKVAQRVVDRKILDTPYPCVSAPPAIAGGYADRSAYRQLR